jgi:hypothetical protein
LTGTPFSLKKGELVPFLRKKGALAPFLIQPAPLLRKKGVPAKLVIPTGNTDRQVNLIPAKYRYQKAAGNTVVYNSTFYYDMSRVLSVSINQSQVTVEL